jgi:hypothetical protein
MKETQNCWQSFILNERMNEFKQKIHIEEHIKQTLIATDERIGIFKTK